MLKPTRIIFNYAARCNMPCGFCYIPFNGQKSTLTERLAYIDRIAELGAELVTFGGGDPLMDRDIDTMIRHAAGRGLKIQLDTNGLCLKAAHIPLLRDHVDFMSLPLEGDAETHAIMRGNKKHFAVVMAWLPRLLDEGIRVKINTVVSRKNIHALPELADILLPFARQGETALARWSLYEFIPAESGETHRTEFELPSGHFDTAIAQIERRFPDLPVEPGPRSARKSAYFFMNDNGAVYISDPSTARDSAVFIGHIMDSDIGEQWASRIAARDRGESFKARASIRLALSR